MLRYESIVPPEVREGAPLLVLLHGRGADRRDLLDLGPALLPGAVVVCPEAPHPGAPWGYGPGWAWYRFLGGSRPEPESFVAGQEALAAFLAALPAELPVRTGPLALGGFSQGGTTALAYALRQPGTVERVLCFSGFLAEHPSVAATPRTVAGARFFWGHGLADAAIPHAQGELGRAALRAAGADLTARDYAMGHGISPEEVRDARAWLTTGPA